MIYTSTFVLTFYVFSSSQCTVKHKNEKMHCRIDDECNFMSNAVIKQMLNVIPLLSKNSLHKITTDNIKLECY